jgi:hypothetical protein
MSSNEGYTPFRYVEAARLVMGRIDLATVVVLGSGQ